MMTAKGMVKLIEECSELSQALAKKLAYYTTDEHPDGGPPLSARIEDEIADVMAACSFVVEMHGLNRGRIAARITTKMATFRGWQADPNNNQDGIDGKKRNEEFERWMAYQDSLRQP